MLICTGQARRVCPVFLLQVADFSTFYERD